jgi:hypothetical protein
MFDQTQSNLLDGLMLGDAYIPPNQALLYFGQQRRNREYVEYIATALGMLIERVRDRARKPDRRTGKVYECSELRSLSHPVYARLRQRWYKDGRKVVPGDFRISPECVLHWFLCDGSCSVNRGGAQLVLCTDAFATQEVEFLRQQLGSVGIEAALITNRRIRVSQRSIERFYRFIGECPVLCMAYKWIPEQNRASSQQTHLKPFYGDIHNLYVNGGWSCREIASKFRTNYYSVRWILKRHFGVSFGKNATVETTCREGLVIPPQRLHAEPRRRTSEDTVRPAW